MGMFVIYLDANIQIPGSSDSLLIATKVKSIRKISHSCRIVPVT